MPVQYIFFDIDDTLFPTTEFAEMARRNAVRAMIENGLGAEQDEIYSEIQRILKKKGSNYELLFDDICKKFRVRQSRTRVVAAAVAAYHNTKSSILPYPEVPSVLLELKQRGYMLYCATNGNAKKQWDKLIRMGIALYFDDVFVSDEVGVRKSGAFFKKVLKKVGAKPDECVMIGDREDMDVVAPKAVGMRTVRMRRGKYADTPTVADIEAKDLREAVHKLNRALRR
ncbi:MAG: TIGR02253 family HAD-type hydrolase [Candidatus Bilamarchaeaceae archaeon]